MQDHNTPFATSFNHLSDLQAYVGKELGLSAWVQITQEQINTFAKATDDHQWIHVNPDRASKHSPYGTTVAHGFLVLSLASKFAYETYSVNDAVMGLNYGLNRVRFPNATPAGSFLRGRVSLLSFSTIPHGARYELKIVFELKGERKPACVAEFIAQTYTASPS